MPAVGAPAETVASGSVRMLMLLPLLAALAPLTCRLRFAPKMSAVDSPSAQEDRGLLPGVLPQLLLLLLAYPLLLVLLLRSYALLAGEAAADRLAAAPAPAAAAAAGEGAVLKAASGLPQPAVIVQVPS